MNEQSEPARGRGRAGSRRPSPLLWVGLLLLLALLVFLVLKLFREPSPLAEPPQTSAETAAPETPPAPETTAPQPSGSEPAVPETEPAPEEGQNSLGYPLLAPILKAADWLLGSDDYLLEIPVDGKRVPQQTVELLALGDNLIHASLLEAALQPDGSYDFHDFYKYIADDVAAVDIACIQQETILINDPKDYTGYPVFGSPTAVGDALIDTGFDVINHCSNHCYDKFTRGIQNSLDYWRQHPEITVLGIHDSAADAEEIRVVECNGIRIAMLSYTYGTNMGRPAQDWEIDFLDRDKVASDIARAKTISDIVLVFTHWGTEDDHSPNSYQKDWAQFIADQGAGAVIGCHTHSLQPLETIAAADGRKVPVFWSMGNFVSHMLHNQNHLGGMARLTIGKDRFGAFIVSSELIPTMSFGSEDSGKWEFYGMRLTDYTDEMAARHFVENTSVKEMWDLYYSIVGEEP